MSPKLACWIFFIVGAIVAWLIRGVVAEKKAKKLEAWQKNQVSGKGYD